MAAVVRWTGEAIRALREARRMSVRAFAEHIGVSDRAVSKWEAGGEAIRPRTTSQAALDALLATADAFARARFERMVARCVVPVDAVTLTAGAELVARHPIDGKLMTLIEEGPYAPPLGDPVWLPGYLIDIHATTCDDYERFAEVTGHVVPKAWPGGNAPARVPWLDAQAYCAWAGKLLPTAVQLQRAATGDEGAVLVDCDAEWSAVSRGTRRAAAAPRGLACFRTVVPAAELLATLAI